MVDKPRDFDTKMHCVAYCEIWRSNYHGSLPAIKGKPSQLFKDGTNQSQRDEYMYSAINSISSQPSKVLLATKVRPSMLRPAIKR